MTKRAVILGGGFAGTTAAHLLVRAGWSVTLFEKEQHLGGGCRTYFYGGHPFTYGPRVYYGYSDKVWAWMNSVVPMRRFPFELRTYVEEDRRFYTYPIHEADIPTMPRAAQIQYELDQRDLTTPPVDFEDYWVKRVGRTLYDMFVNGYSKKMWMIDDNRVFDIFKWSAKDRPIETGTREAYKGSYLGYPIPGDAYNGYFDRMVDGVDVRYGTTACWYPERSAVIADGREIGYDALITTIPVDEFFGYCLGELPYVGREFSVFILPCKQAFPGDVRFCHYAGTEPWTRITEFKKITYHESEDTLLVAEKPSKANKLYPYVTKANEALAAKYLAMLTPGVHSIGRLGTYKYSTIEQTIVQAFGVVAKITDAPNEISGEWRGIGDVAMMKDRKEGE